MKQNIQLIIIRAGLATKGLIYITVGFIALLSVVGSMQKRSDSKGAIRWFLEQPFGPYIVLGIAAGLFCYAGWKLARAFLGDPEHSDDKIRIIHGLGGLGYISIALYAVGLGLRGLQITDDRMTSGSGSNKEQIVRLLLDSTTGKIMLILAVFAILGFAYSQLHKALSGNYREQVNASKLDNRYKRLLIKAGCIGYIGRATTFCILAYLLGMAIWHHNPNKVGGTSDAFDFLKGMGGELTVSALAVGMICYGIFALLQARYRDLHVVV